MNNDGLKYHYSNPKFAGKPWAIEASRKKKKAKVSRGKRKRLKKKLRKAKFLPNPHEFDTKVFLEKFWPKFESLPNTAMRLEYLSKAARPPWSRVENSIRLQLRKIFLKHYGSFLSQIDRHCGVCGDNVWREKHHIVPLSHGGINENVNLIAICTQCHDEIHPWMKEESPYA